VKTHTVHVKNEASPGAIMKQHEPMLNNIVFYCIISYWCRRKG